MYYYGAIALGNTSPEVLRDYAIVEAMVSGADQDLVHAVLKGESKYRVDVRDGDMGIKCPVGVNKGKPVRARGVGQITECYHPEVSDAQAYDPIFAIQWVVNKIADGKCAKEFSTCPLRYKNISFNSR